ncbi:HtaA domain-containing protein [Streptomyces althioticus]|uniref:HtaA domain-containing protein n=1 Tax=Streptomyces althioticus TaxID=83380 RepID=UPI00379AFD0A
MSARRRRSLALAAAVATAAALGATAAPSAAAAEVPLAGYELTWGIKASYRNYVADLAQGTFTPTRGASQAESNGAFTFTGGTGTYDSTTHVMSLGFRGDLHIKSEKHGFDIGLSDVRFDSGEGEITADVERDGTTEDDVPLATVTVTRAMTEMVTTLTEEAGEVFGSAGYAGAEGDPLSIVKKADPEPEPEPSTTGPATTPPASPSTEPTGSATPTAGASPTTQAPTPTPSTSASQSTAPATQGEIADGTLDWGVKQSFRAYVTGPVAKGTITASDGATQASGNGAFTFSDATGTYDTEAGALEVAFKGAVTFKGHEHDGAHSLGLTLGDLRVNLSKGRGTLSADVDDLGETSQNVVLADLSAPSPTLTAKDDVITLDKVTATLTEAGAEAFGGFYAAGAELDPVRLAVALTEGAELPAGSGGTGGDATGGSGSGTGTGTDGGPDASGSTTGGAGSTVGGDLGGSLASTGADVPVGALGAAAGAAVAAGAGVVLALHRRRPAAE